MTEAPRGVYIPFSHSLKEKRKHIKSLKDRLRHKFNVSVAEIDGQEEWQKSVIGISMINSDKRYLESQSQAIEQIILEYTDLELMKFQKEWI